MIASVDGVVAVISLDSLVLEVGGIGYRVFAAPRVIASARPGGRLKLFTHHLVPRIARRSSASPRPRSSASSTCC